MSVFLNSIDKKRFQITGLFFLLCAILIILGLEWGWNAADHPFILGAVSFCFVVGYGLSERFSPMSELSKAGPSSEGSDQPKENVPKVLVRR
jgi:hypothetical protein